MKSPAYNLEGETKPLFCSQHRSVEMIDMVHKKCSSSWCFTRANKKYDNYCMFCYINIYPDNPIVRNYKTKEKTVVDSIISNFPNMSWNSDKRVVDGCSKRRPDLLLDLGYQIIIIEIDENQHDLYDCICENKRIMELSQDVGHRPIIFIRFNPDSYINCHNKIVSSCWSINNKSRIIYVNKNKQNEWTMRLETLKSQIQYWLKNATNKTIEVIQLYYNGME